MQTLISVSSAARLLAMLLLVIPAVSSATRNASGNGQWISLGVPAGMSLGTNGVWKEFYAFFLYAASQRKALECIVDSGCASAEVWVSYCGAEQL